MLKIGMASPVADAKHHGGKTFRSIQAFTVHGEIDRNVLDFIKSEKDVWFDFIKVNDGKRIFINAMHIAWIEEIDENRQISRPS